MLVINDTEGCRKMAVTACYRDICFVPKNYVTESLASGLRIETGIFWMPGCTKPAYPILILLVTWQRFVGEETGVVCTTCSCRLNMGC